MDILPRSESLAGGRPDLAAKQLTQGTRNMAQLEQATQRLQSALDRLDSVVESLAARNSGNGAEELRAKLDATQQENVTLQELTGAVAERLDDTIERLQSALEA
jgi:uncharacterized protein YukE